MTEIKKVGHLSKQLSEKQKFEDLLLTAGEAIALSTLQGEPEVMVQLRSTIRADLNTCAEMFLAHSSVDPQAIIKLLEKCEALENMHARMSQPLN